MTAEREATKLPYSLNSIVLEEVYYRVKQCDGGKVVVPFQRANNGTRLSTDVHGRIVNRKELYVRVFSD